MTYENPFFMQEQGHYIGFVFACKSAGFCLEALRCCWLSVVRAIRVECQLYRTVELCWLEFGELVGLVDQVGS